MDMELAHSQGDHLDVRLGDCSICRLMDQRDKEVGRPMTLRRYDSAKDRALGERVTESLLGRLWRWLNG